MEAGLGGVGAEVGGTGFGLGMWDEVGLEGFRTGESGMGVRSGMEGTKGTEGTEVTEGVGGVVGVEESRRVCRSDRTDRADTGLAAGFG